MSSSKRHFTAVVGSKEHGLYISSSPSSAARKIVSKLCSVNKNKKVEFCVRETTQKSEKKTYGPYIGEIKKNSFIVHLKKDKLNKIIKGGRVERFGIIEPTDLMQREANKSEFAVIRKNYFRKPYLFFNPIQNPISGTSYYTNVAYETFLFRKPVIKQIKKNKVEDIDIMKIEMNILEQLKNFIETNRIFSNLHKKIIFVIEKKKELIKNLKNKQYINRLQKRILTKPQQQQPQQQPIIFSSNLKNIKIIETEKKIDLKSIKYFKASINCNFQTRKPYHTSNKIKNNCDIIIKKEKDSESYYIFFIIEKFINSKINLRTFNNNFFYRYVVYYKDLRIIFKKLNDDLSIVNIDIKSINIEILLFLLNFIDILVKENNCETQNGIILCNILKNIHEYVLKEVKSILKELYSSNENVNYKKINYSIFENMNNISNTEQLIRDGFFIQYLNTKKYNNSVITKSDIRGKICKINDITYIFFNPIQLLELRNKTAYYYNNCVYESSGYVRFKKVYKNQQSEIITEDITNDEIKTEDFDKLIDFILYKKEYNTYKNICDSVINFIIDKRTIRNLDNYTIKKLKEFFNKEKQEKQKNVPTFYKTINETLQKKLN